MFSGSSVPRAYAFKALNNMGLTCLSQMFITLILSHISPLAKLNKKLFPQNPHSHWAFFPVRGMPFPHSISTVKTLPTFQALP